MREAIDTALAQTDTTLQPTLQNAQSCNPGRSIHQITAPTAKYTKLQSPGRNTKITVKTAKDTHNYSPHGEVHKITRSMAKYNNSFTAPAETCIKLQPLRQNTIGCPRQNTHQNYGPHDKVQQLAAPWEHTSHFSPSSKYTKSQPALEHTSNYSPLYKIHQNYSRRSVLTTCMLTTKKLKPHL